MQLYKYGRQDSWCKQGSLQIYLALNLIFLVILGPGSSFVKSETADNPELVIQSGHINPVSSVAFSPDGHSQINANAIKNISIWEITLECKIHSLIDISRSSLTLINGLFV